MLIYGHRGASRRLPENTLAAFQRAIEDGVDGLEIDVQRTADGVPVILHDREVARTSNGSGAVDRMTLADLKRIGLDGAPIPTLAETLDLVGDRAHLDLEIKQPGIAADTLGVLAGFPAARWALSSFDWPTIEDARRLAPDAELWLLATHLAEALFDFAAGVDAAAIALWAPALTEANVRRLTDHGLLTIGWTVNDPAAARRAREIGVAGLCTDVPDAIISGLAE